MDTYKIPLPQSLGELAPTGSMTFCAVSSRPVTLKGLPKDTLCDLVRTLIQTVHRDFQSCSSPEGFLVRVFSTAESDIDAEKVILLGASNLGNCAESLRQHGLDVLDLTIPGWIASPNNVSSLEEKLSTVVIGKRDNVILDLYSNLSYRFEQFDGTQSLPYKSGGRYHLAGDVVACLLATFKNILESTSRLLLIGRQNSLIIIPPLPRYLFSGCCNHTNQCPNVGKPEHPGKLLTEVIGLRNCLKKHVSSIGIQNCRVLETCCVTDCIGTADINTRIEALKQVTAKDSIHFLATGYDNLVKHIMLTLARPACTTNRKHNTAKVHYWRGFRSPIGSSLVANHVMEKTACQHSRGRGDHSRSRYCGHQHHNRFHPYRRN
jgi:hypothetical protein